MYTIRRQASNNVASIGGGSSLCEPQTETIYVKADNMQELLAKKYTFNLPNNPFNAQYEIALGGFNIFTNGTNSISAYAVDANGFNVTPIVTSPNFTVGNTGSLGYLKPSPALVQFANMVANTPHLIAGMRATYDSSFSPQQSVFALSYFSSLKNSMRQSVPFVSSFTEAIAISRQDYNDQCNDFIFDSPVILDGNSFINYAVAFAVGPVIGGVTVQIALLSVMELANIKSHEQFLNIMRQVRSQCFCN